MKFPFQRRQAAPAPERLEPVRDIPEQNIAVGSLAGIPPADVRASLLLVMDAEGGLSYTGVACDELALAMLTKAAAAVSRQVLAAHAHGGGQ